MGRISGISGLAMSCIVAGTCFGTPVTLAEDSCVIAESQPAAPGTEKPPRRWHSFNSEQPTERAPREVDNYTGWLLSGYLAAPLLLFGIPSLTRELTTNPVVQTTSLVLGLGAAVLTPAIVHSIAGDHDLAVRAAIAYPAITVGSIGLGFLVGFAVSPGDTELTENRRLFHAAIGGVLGAGAAWLGWGLFDLIDTGSGADSASHVKRARSISVSLLPLPGGIATSIAGSF